MSFDFVIVGGGPGGYTAALRAASLGASVALVEKENLGGVCLNWGCIPTKALLKSSKLLELMQNAKAYGLSCENPGADLPAVISRKDKVVSQLRTGLIKLFEQRKIELINGQGVLISPSQVKVSGPEGERTIEGRHIIWATGGQVVELPSLPVDGKRVLDIRQALDLSELPAHMLIVGAGVIGCEMAQFFSGLGCKISLVELLQQPLGGWLDADVEKLVVRSFKKRKYKTYFGQSVTSLEAGDGGVTANLDSGKSIEADAVLVAVGMRPFSAGMGLEEAGVELGRRGEIKVNEHAQTSLDSVYAIGDVTGLQPLAHFAAHMGLVAVHHALGRGHAELDTEWVPKAVFIEPELAWVGLSEAAAKERYGDVLTGSFMVRGLGRATAEGRIDGLIKLVARAEDKVLVGAHVYGAEADGLIGEATLALAHGITLEGLANTIHAHPTYGEGLMEAAEDALGLPIHGA